jgi:hypothetical protein
MPFVAIRVRRYAWVSRSQRHLVKALTAQGFRVSQGVVGKLLRELNYSCQANRKTREGSNTPDRNAQFEHVNARVRAAIAGEPAISVDTKKKELVGISKTTAVNCDPRGILNRCACTTSRSQNSARLPPYGVCDIAANHGWVSVGISADTGAFRCREHPPLVVQAWQGAAARPIRRE